MRVSNFFVSLAFFCSACVDSYFYDINKPFEDIDIICSFEHLDVHSQYDFRLFKVFERTSIPKTLKLPFFKCEDDAYPLYSVKLLKNDKKSVIVFYGYINSIRATLFMEYDYTNFLINRFCLVADTQDYTCSIWDTGNINTKIKKEIEVKLDLLNTENNIGFPEKLIVTLDFTHSFFSKNELIDLIN